ncbi:MAG: nitrate/nitrite transporter NrtS [Cyanobacteria bacterium J06642_2]
MRAVITNRQALATATRVALVVGSILFAINHGAALVQQQMSRDRWISAALTYLVPFGVSLHGQSAGTRRSAKS